MITISWGQYPSSAVNENRIMFNLIDWKYISYPGYDKPTISADLSVAKDIPDYVLAEIRQQLPDDYQICEARAE